MNEIEYFKAVQRFGSVTETRKDREIREAKENQLRELKGSMYCEDVEISGNPKSLIVVPDSSNTNEMVINALPFDTFEVGEIVKYRDLYWLITEKKRDEKIQCKGKMTLCNHNLRWQDFNDNIREVQCVIQDPYSRQPRENNVTNHAYSTVTALVPFNDDTRKLYVDQRFILWTVYSQDGREIPDVYKITDIKQKNSDYGDRHIIKLLMTRDTSHEKDSVEMMIADYIPIESATPIPKGKKFCEMKVKDTVAVGGTRTATPSFEGERIMSAKVYDGDGFVSEAHIGENGVKAVWRTTGSVGVEYETGLTADGYLKISLSKDKKQIGGYIDVCLEDEDGIYQPQNKRIEVV